MPDNVCNLICMCQINLARIKNIYNFVAEKPTPRKDAGVVDRDGLENRCTLTGTQGSNPCLSANDADVQ